MRNETGLPGDEVLVVLRQLCPRLERAGSEHYGELVGSAAWMDFSRWGLDAVTSEEQAYESAFRAWYLFSWLPDDSTLAGESFTSALSDHSIAVDFLETRRKELSPVEQRVIKAATSAPYSFYTVQAVTNDHRLHLQEIYTEQTVVVEPPETRYYAEGEVLFSAVVSIDGVSVLLGCMPNALPANNQSVIQAHREKWKAEEGGRIDRRLLYLHDTELRRFYFTLLSRSQKASLH